MDDIDFTAIAASAAALNEPTWNGAGEPAHAGSPARRLDETFWNARPRLTHIRRAAHARHRAPDALLHAVLARVSAIVPFTLELPAVVGSPSPLCHFAVGVAPSGGGKTTVAAIATDLLPATVGLADQLPVGSGEGLIEALFDVVTEEDDQGKQRRVKRQVRHNAFVYVDEGLVLGAIGARTGSTLLATLRSAWSGSTLGNTNASEERKRIVPAGLATFGIVVGIQSAHAGALLNDVDAGTPQRFCWVSAIDPAIPDDAPDWPGPLTWSPPDPGHLEALRIVRGGLTRHQLAVPHPIRHEIVTADLARQRGKLTVAPLDAHRNLIRLRVAALLAILDDRLDINATDWRLAAHIIDASDATRAHVEAIVNAETTRREQATSHRLAARHVDADTAVTRNRIDATARTLWRKVNAAPTSTAAELRRRCSTQQRDIFDDALTHATDMGWLTEHREPGQGDDKRTIEPGPETPR
jgi:hypothetical protein